MVNELLNNFMNTLEAYKEAVQNQRESEIDYDNVMVKVYYSAAKELSNNLRAMYTNALHYTDIKEVKITKLTPEQMEYVKSMKAHGYFRIDHYITPEELEALKEGLAYTE